MERKKSGCPSDEQMAQIFAKLEQTAGRNVAENARAVWREAE